MEVTKASQWQKQLRFSQFLRQSHRVWRTRGWEQAAAILTDIQRGNALSSSHGLSLDRDPDTDPRPRSDTRGDNQKYFISPAAEGRSRCSGASTSRGDLWLHACSGKIVSRRFQNNDKWNRRDGAERGGCHFNPLGFADLVVKGVHDCCFNIIVCFVHFYPLYNDSFFCFIRLGKIYVANSW